MRARARKDTQQMETLVETTNFAIFSLKQNAKTFFDMLLGIIKTGKLSYHNKTVLFTDNLDKPSVTPSFKEYVSGNSERSKDLLGIDWPVDYFLYEWHNNTLQNELTNRKRIADKQVHCHDPPFESVVDAIQSLMYVERWDTALNRSHLLLILPTYLKINSCLLDGDNFQTSINLYEAINLENVRLSLIGHGPKIVRKLVKFDKQLEDTETPSIVTAKTQTILKEVSDVQTYLFLQSDAQVSIDAKLVRNKRSQINHKMMAHETFDVGSEKILEYLQSEPFKDSTQFEWAITTTLHFSGFYTEWLGRRRLGDVPDVLAFYPDENVLIVGECTIGVPDENKIIKLQERKERLKSMNMTVRAVIFSKASEVMLKEIALPPNITIISKQQIQEMFEMASQGSSTKQIYLNMFRTSVLPSS
jgi:hypothetical protein